LEFCAASGGKAGVRFRSYVGNCHFYLNGLHVLLMTYCQANRQMSAA